MTPNPSLVADQTLLEEGAVTLVQTSQTASWRNMIWSFLCVLMNANLKDMNICMVERYCIHKIKYIHKYLKCLLLVEIFEKKNAPVLRLAVKRKVSIFYSQRKLSYMLNHNFYSCLSSIFLEENAFRIVSQQVIMC